MIDLTDLATALLGIMGTLIAIFLIPYIKQHVSAEKLANAKVIIEAAVKAAEMIFVGNGRGQEKKEYVIKIVTNYLNAHKIKIDFGVIEDLIESSVLDMKAQLDK